MNKAKLSEDWLAGNAIVAFMGALLFAQYWQRSDETFELPFNVSVSALPDLVVDSIVVFLVAMSLVFALASIVPSLRSWAHDQASSLSHVLGMLIWFAFIISWAPAIGELPSGHWWAPAMEWAGIGMFFIILCRFVYMPPIVPLVKFLYKTCRRLLVSDESGDV